MSGVQIFLTVFVTFVFGFATGFMVVVTWVLWDLKDLRGGIPPGRSGE
jgi:hypothetical protein